MQRGQVWAYRARRVDPLVAVEVLRVGTKRPPRVLVRFQADEFEGREAWTPPGRLKTPWSQVQDFEAWEARWTAVIAASPVRDTAEESTASLVFDELIDPQLATLGYNQTAGVAMIADVAGLARSLDLSADQLRADPVAFDDDGVLVLPWPVTEVIARRAAQRDPEPLLRSVDASEAQQRHNRIHGRSFRVSRGGPVRHLDAEYFAEADEQPHQRPYREVVRRWCGVEAVGRRDELTELRREVARLAGLVEDAVGALRRAGAAGAAARIEGDLGITVDTLRNR